MRLLYCYIFIAFFLIIGCGKDTSKPDNTGETLSATYTFATAGQTDGGYFDNSRKEQRGFTINASKSFSDNVRVGDEIRLFMNRQSIASIGNFQIRLSINGKFIQEVDGNDKLTIQLLYRVTDKDFQ